MELIRQDGTEGPLGPMKPKVYNDVVFKESHPTGASAELPLVVKHRAGSLVSIHSVYIYK
jgi:hypothetical protein